MSFCPQKRGVWSSDPRNDGNDGNGARHARKKPFAKNFALRPLTLVDLPLLAASFHEYLL